MSPAQQNTRKLPHPAWGPKTRRTGRRQQEWPSKQRPPSETGSSLQDAMRDSSGGKTADWPRNEPGTFQKGPGTKLAPPPLLTPPTHPHTKRGLGVEGPPPPSVGWCHSTKGGGRGGRARPRATNHALHAVRSSRRSLSLRHNVSIASTQACHTTKLNQNSGSVSDCVRRQGVVPFRPASRFPKEQRTPLRSLLKMQQSPRDITFTPELTSLGEKCFGRPNSQSDAHLRCALRATGL